MLPSVVPSVNNVTGRTFGLEVVERQSYCTFGPHDPAVRKNATTAVDLGCDQAHCRLERTRLTWRRGNMHARRIASARPSIPHHGGIHEHHADWRDWDWFPNPLRRNAQLPRGAESRHAIAGRWLRHTVGRIVR